MRKALKNKKGSFTSSGVKRCGDQVGTDGGSSSDDG
jgi:hypothetical protein